MALTDEQLYNINTLVEIYRQSLIEQEVLPAAMITLDPASELFGVMTAGAGLDKLKLLVVLEDVADKVAHGSYRLKEKNFVNKPFKPKQ
jgi:hypothetical protein